MRVMCGSDFNLDVEQRMMETLVSLIGEAGLIYNPPGELGDYPGGTADCFQNGRMMLDMMAWHQRDHDPAWLGRLQGMAEGLDEMAIHRDDRAYYPNECGWSREAGWKLTRRGGEAYFPYSPPEEPSREQQGVEGTVKGHMGYVARALARWYAKSGDEKALELARRVVNFMLKPGMWEPGQPTDLVGPEHGIFGGHFHFLSRSAANMGVAVNPGAMQLTLMLCLVHSTASA